GTPLTDDDRAPWLASLARLIGDHVRERRPMVLACSALSRAHRAALVSLAPAASSGDVRFVHLRADAELLARRLAHRTGHFFPPVLLASQLAALEEWGSDAYADQELDPESDPAPDPGVEPDPRARPGARSNVVVLDADRPVSELVAEIRAAFGV